MSGSPTDYIRYLLLLVLITLLAIIIIIVIYYIQYIPIHTQKTTIIHPSYHPSIYLLSLHYHTYTNNIIFYLRYL